MDAMYHHLSRIGIWRDFYRILKSSYRYTGIIRHDALSVTRCLNKIPKVRKNIKFQMYVFRFFAAGECSNAKPCAECTRWVYIAKHLGVYYDIYYTNDDERLSRFSGDCNTYCPQTTYF
jgi:hypothetical protein